MKNKSEWIPDRHPSKGADAYHKAVINTSWHIANVTELIKKIRNFIKINSVIVDFGAGTGSSAVFLVKNFPKAKLILTDNSASWLTNSYNILHKKKNIKFFLLKKQNEKYLTLNKLVGNKSADIILAFNTVHLIPDISYVFEGIYDTLKKGGKFAFQSGNIKLKDRKDGIMMIDDSISKIHDISIDIIRNDKRFKKYKKDIKKKIKEQVLQRKIIFPLPRNLDLYTKALKSAGFKNQKISRKVIRIKFKDWLDFLRVKRLQAGILPEIGGRFPAKDEISDRDQIITIASKKLFSDLKKNNPMANSSSFCAEWVYVIADKI